MIRIIFISFQLLLLAIALPAQTYLDWIALGEIELTKKTNLEFGISYDEAVFSEYIEELDSTEVTISGYMIPLDALGTSFALSRNPNASCFFCGNAGPETVLRLWFTPSAMKRYNTDDYLRIKGQLRLHASNEHGFIYELWNAAPI